ncbi:MAG TPA: RodZ domain-containing protein [Burkholderiales bacterium]
MSETGERGAPPFRDGPGRMLAQLRGERKLSIADVAQRLKYGARQIEALEAEEFDKLPGSTFVRGMVRGYAKLLDTDPEPVLSALDERYIPGETDLDLRDKGIPFAQGGKHGTGTYLVLSILVLVILGGVLYEWGAGAFPWARFASTMPLPQEQANPGTTPAVAKIADTRVAETKAAETKPAETKAPGIVTEIATEPTAAPVKRASGGEGRIKLEFDRESWVEIREQGGKTLMSQLNPAGSRRLVVGRPPLNLVIGNAAAVRVTYNDSPVDLKPYIEIEVARLTLD